MDPVIGLAALVAAALFTGAAAYINLAEHPARSQLAVGPMLAQWKPAYARGLRMQVSLILIGCGSGLAAWWMDGGVARLVGTVLLAANIPYTLLAIMPINRRLEAVSPDAADASTRRMLDQWAKLHAGRSLLGAASVLSFLAAGR